MLISLSTIVSIAPIIPEAPFSLGTVGLLNLVNGQNGASTTRIKVKIRSHLFIIELKHFFLSAFSQCT